MQLIIRVIILLVLVGTLAGVSGLYSAISAANHAEHALHAAILTIQLLDDYVARSEGQWPRSWPDLEELPPRQWSMFRWPDDSREVQAYVTVDFSADPHDFATQGADQFNAVRQVEPYFTYKNKGYVEALLETIRKHAPDERRFDELDDVLHKPTLDSASMSP